MAASYQAKDSQILQQQLRVQELTLKGDSTLFRNDGTDLFIELNEPIEELFGCVRYQIYTADFPGTVVTMDIFNTTQIRLIAQGANGPGYPGPGPDYVFVVKYVTHE